MSGNKCSYLNKVLEFETRCYETSDIFFLLKSICRIGQINNLLQDRAKNTAQITTTLHHEGIIKHIVAALLTSPPHQRHHTTILQLQP